MSGSHWLLVGALMWTRRRGDGEIHRRVKVFPQSGWGWVRMPKEINVWMMTIFSWPYKQRRTIWESFIIRFIITPLTYPEACASLSSQIWLNDKHSWHFKIPTLHCYCYSRYGKCPCQCSCMHGTPELALCHWNTPGLIVSFAPPPPTPQTAASHDPAGSTGLTTKPFRLAVL